MPANTRRRLLGLVVLLVVSTVSLPANATSERLLVTGGGYLGGNSMGLSASAGIFSAFSAWPDGPSIFGFGTVGVPTSVSWGVIPFWGQPGYTEVNYGNTFTDILSGLITFHSSFTIPASALTTGTFTAPVSVSGFIQAFQDLGDFNKGPLIATLAFSGTGTATFRGFDIGNNEFLIVSANVTFTNATGTLTAAPEPSSLLLLGTGLLGLAFCLRRRHPSPSPATVR